MYENCFKRILDCIISTLLFIFFFPLFLLIAVILFFSLKGSPFFTQFRPGIEGKIFKLIKFKTMNDRKDAQGELLPDIDRLTPIGKFIRKTSLDEIPQLLNVIKGDMSIVGPRPLLVEYLPLYNNFQKRRHEVRPGITGLAQINGRNAITWKEKFEYDVWYVDHISLALDAKILIATFSKVFKSEGISQKGHATMSKFTGN
ncbi:sugar transferase [Compostibacter hankyongensis]|uniref:sugar transferase n=1 Tax=Compostibacter hankyongensis TaxID=1007089 RepID=UPI0031EE17FF